MLSYSYAPVLFFFAVSAFDTEFFISGLAPLADQLVTLYYVKENSDQMVLSYFLLYVIYVSLINLLYPYY